ncbi:DUF1266 domain-containing protein [Streptomyces sp. NPDC053542]|uniref:DUF1266 domain-containing protein n=1 Tax=Streptomyces sp. NPDC053542 TaxID=3365710 RepID=UPI0037D6CFF3
MTNGPEAAAGPDPAEPADPAEPTAPAAPVWQAPSEVEQQLYDAKTRGDWPAYFDVLARNELYIADSRAAADAHPGTVRFQPYWDRRTGTLCLAAFTLGMLPAPVEDPVFWSGSLDWFARNWEAHDPPWLAVNPGSPCEAYFPTSPGHRAVWQRHAAAAAAEEPQQQIRLRTLHVGGPLHGPVAHGLACGALLFVNNGRPWNAMAHHGRGYYPEKKQLAEFWNVTDRATWQQAQERLTAADMVSEVWEFALAVRRSLALDFAGAVSVDHWRGVAERVLRHNAEKGAEVKLTPEGVTKTEPPGEAEVASQVAGVQRLIGRIARYEARFRADGVLAEGKFVRSVEAWDYGRASGMARWGLGARYCTLPEAEQAVLRAGAASRSAYRSWEDFSAGFILGRCLQFDEEEFGHWYTDMATAHQILTTDPASPWRNIPWE